MVQSSKKLACSIEGCTKGGRQLWRGWCAMHYRRWQKHGDPLIERPQGRQPGTYLKEDNPRWVGDRVRYKSAHFRVMRERGLAATYSCSHCGSPAAHWAYDRTDPEPLTDVYRGYRIEYSGNPAYYIPLCIPCHRKFDVKVKV